MVENICRRLKPLACVFPYGLFALASPLGRSRVAPNATAISWWSEQSGDAERRSPQVPMLVKNVLKQAKPGAIVLLHDGGGNRSKSVKALPEMIAGLKTQGYRFVTIPQLLEIQAQEQSAVTAVSSVTTNHEHPNHPLNHQ